jgi:hypothetical protein
MQTLKALLPIVGRFVPQGNLDPSHREFDDEKDEFLTNFPRLIYALPFKLTTDRAQMNGILTASTGAVRSASRLT